MDKQKLIDLYRQYCGSADTRIYKDKELYHQEYRKLQNNVVVMRESLNKGYELDKDRDSGFLESLVTDFHSGVAAAGKGALTAEERLVIKDDKVLWAIGKVIKTPQAETGEKLKEAIRLCLRENKYLIVNRIIAACTSDVSSIVDRVRFSLTLDFLIEKKIINNYIGKCSVKITEKSRGKHSISWATEKEMGITEWYDENCYLIKELREFIKNEVGEEPETIHLVTFPWYIWMKELADIYSEVINSDYY